MALTDAPAFETQLPTANFEIVRGIDALARLKEAWIALEGALGEPDFFQSFAWSMHVASIRIANSGSQFEPLAGVLRSGGRTIGLWPLSRQRKAGQWELRAIDDPFGQLTCVLAIDGASSRQLVVETLNAVRTSGLAHSACFERVIQGSALASALSLAGAKARNPVDAPFLDFRPYASFAEFRQSRNKKTMKNLRNSFNRAERAGVLASTRSDTQEGCRAIARTALDMREAWLAATGKTAPAFRVAGFAEVLAGGEAWGLGAKQLAFELTLDNRSIAQQIGFRHGGRYYAYISGMDWAHEDLGPGRMHLARVMEDAMGLGLDGAELLTPASDYKLVWTDDRRRLADMVLALSLAGRVKQSLWDEGLRPAFKSAYYAMPAPLRRMLTGRAHAGVAVAGNVAPRRGDLPLR